MPNQYLDTSWISMEVLRLLKNKLEVASFFNTDYDKDFKQKFAVGSSIQVKFPQRFLIRDGLAYSAQPISRIATTVNLDQVFGIDFEWDSYEQAVKMERSEAELREQYLDPAADQLAQEVDSRAAKFAYQNASNVVGALGTDSTAVNNYLAAERRLFEKACAPGKRGMIVSGSMMQVFAQNQTTIFNPSDEISMMYKKGIVGMAAGWEWYRSNSLYSHTAGTWAGAVTVSGAGQTGTTLNVVCTTGDTFFQGDKFSILNVNAVNPVTRRISGPGTAQNFTITQDTVGVGSAAALSILPPIYGPGSQYQNVDALPANGAALTLWPGTAAPSGKVGTVGLGISKSAFALVGGELELPKAMEIATQKRDPKTGLAVRFIRGFDIRTSQMLNRFDMCIGFGNLYQDNGVVAVAGA